MAAVFPGGFGVAKQLSTFAAVWAHCSIHQEVLAFAQAMAQNKNLKVFYALLLFLCQRSMGKV